MESQKIQQKKVNDDNRLFKTAYHQVLKESLDKLPLDRHNEIYKIRDNKAMSFELKMQSIAIEYDRISREIAVSREILQESSYDDLPVDYTNNQNEKVVESVRAPTPEEIQASMLGLDVVELKKQVGEIEKLQRSVNSNQISAEKAIILAHNELGYITTAPERILTKIGFKAYEIKRFSDDIYQWEITEYALKDPTKFVGGLFRSKRVSIDVKKWFQTNKYKDFKLYTGSQFLSDQTIQVPMTDQYRVTTNSIFHRIVLAILNKFTSVGTHKIGSEIAELNEILADFRRELEKSEKLGDAGLGLGLDFNEVLNSHKLLVNEKITSLKIEAAGKKPTFWDRVRARVSPKSKIVRHTTFARQNTREWRTVNLQSYINDFGVKEIGENWKKYTN